jgi:hypothetical protein
LEGNEKPPTEGAEMIRTSTIRAKFSINKLSGFDTRPGHLIKHTNYELYTNI